MQPPLRNILVPTDGTPVSDKAIELAGSLAASLHATLTVVHVVQETAFGGASLDELDPELRDHRIEELARPVLDRAYAVLARNPAAPSPGEHLVVGVAHEQVLAAIQELSIDLLVLGRTHHSHLGELIFGSTSDELIERAPCPVVVVK